LKVFQKFKYGKQPLFPVFNSALKRFSGKCFFQCFGFLVLNLIFASAAASAGDGYDTACPLKSELPQESELTEQNRSVSELLEEAEKLKLHEDPYWLKLLHYKKGLFGIKSLVDDPAFFLAKKGKTDPEAELKALITTFFPHKTGDATDICGFIARYTWLRETLDISEDEFPRLHCPKAESVEPRSATVVFPTYFMNNPASMFGHTFINVSTEYENSLLSNAVNYSAYTGDANGCFYTFNGIFGLFKGYYSISPYYKKLQEYSDMDQRDMWEYNLNLTDEELKRLVLHVFELENIYSDYYFFDENCSYNLLFLLEVARPDVNLTDRFGMWVIPIDTIKLLRDEGFISDVSYRPSVVTDIKQKLSALPARDANIAIGIAMGKGAVGPLLDPVETPGAKAKIIDLATMLLKYRYTKKKIPQTEYSKQMRSVLKERSRLGKMPAKNPTQPPFNDPSLGHDASRLSVASGVRENHVFQEVQFRPSFSDVISSDYSDRTGIQLQLLNTRIRYYNRLKQTRLEQLDIFDAISLSPGDVFFKPVSWKVSAGARRKRFKSGREKLVGHLKVGIGLSRFYETLGLVYGFPLLEVDVSSRYQSSLDVGGGAKIGLFKKFGKKFKGALSAESLFFSSGDKSREHRLSGTIYWRTSQNSGLGASAEAYLLGNHHGEEASLFFNYFF
jgi:hypothetical protein